MLLDRWRARKALATRTPPSSIEDPPPAELTAVVDDLAVRLKADNSLGDPIWHHRWEGELQLVGLDARHRSVADLRQRLARTVHEMALRHVGRRARRVLAVVLCAPDGDEGLVGWHARLADDRGEVGEADWRRVRRQVAVLALDDAGEQALFGGAGDVRAAVAAWAAQRG